MTGIIPISDWRSGEEVMEPPTDKNHTDARTGPATTSSVEDHRAGSSLAINLLQLSRRRLSAKKSASWRSENVK
ncbi:MAG: hypothetical protein KBB04_00745 [Methanothrix sp.]|uniref:hypothetical protein n=1 Tax=Methanothrix sp. TaxID=90426 RepID=UPI001B679D5C|nr:hypothetical protein [Methanothrix sp.]MBP7066798.1 hypothetical protein [Methanothrix sp.]